MKDFFNIKVRGLLFTLGVLAIIETLRYFSIWVPKAVVLLTIVVVYAAFTGGLWMGISSALIVIVYMAFSLSLPGLPFHYGSDATLELVVVAVGMTAVTTVVILLKQRADAATVDLRESEERYRHLVINSRDMIALHQVDGGYEYVSPTAQSLIGHSSDDLLGKSFYEFIHPDDRDLVKNKTEEAILKHKTPIVLDYRFRCKDNSYLWLETVVQPILDAQKKVRRFQTSSRDISERKRAEQMKDEFISTVSHELRTPLTIIKGAISNLKDGVVGPMNDKQTRVVEISGRNVDRLARIINDLLDLSRLESGKSFLNRRRIEIDHLIKETLQNFQWAAKEKNIDLSSAVEPKLPTFYADPDMIVQVLTNLLNNALRFTRTWVKVQAKLVNGSVQVSVTDDGTGIAPEDMYLLFNKFQQIHRPSGGAGYKGTGLGLAISKEIIDKHQGRIWAESVVGKGATFYFSLPVDLRGSSR